ncbi:MAG TPA: 2OG-Fe(II) oxygenase [Bacteroidia bacterium]|jgi:SM-20-related protein|nr:2OG-Fe(II) oxygenase [Bacteroidia bacterium]
MNVLEKICEDFYRNSVAVYDDFISGKEVCLLLNNIKSRKNYLQKAGIGNKLNYRLNSVVRGDFIEWIDPEKETLFADIYLNKLSPVIEVFNKTFFLNISKSEHHIAFYPTGTHYAKHVDTFKNSDARLVSSVLYLNKDWTAEHGGELCIYSENGTSQKIEPKSGRLVLFESILSHEVLECHAPRYSITGWFKRNSLF